MPIKPGSIESYDPASYAGTSPRYKSIWALLKLQAAAVKFISNLVLARGEVLLAPAFLNLVKAVKMRKDADNYKCAREDECILLTKSWVNVHYCGSVSLQPIFSVTLSLCFTLSLYL